MNTIAIDTLKYRLAAEERGVKALQESIAFHEEEGAKEKVRLAIVEANCAALRKALRQLGAK